MLKHVGLINGKNVSIMDVPLNDEEENYIHTISCGNQNNPPLLLVHGYANSAIFFYLCLQEFAKDFKVYAIDFIGNGSSKRCKFYIHDAKESIDFIVEKIDLWRESLRINKMHILGHSLGGCMIGWYTLKHPERVIQAYFVSPAGFSSLITSLKKGTNLKDFLKRDITFFLN